MSLPEGYIAIEKTEGGILVGVSDFLLQGASPPMIVEYEGEKYSRGMLSIIPSRLSHKICSCREYDLIKTVTPDRLYFSQRNKLEKIIDEWAHVNKVSNCPLNAVAFLQEKGLININKVIEFLENKTQCDCGSIVDKDEIGKNGECPSCRPF